MAQQVWVTPEHVRTFASQLQRDNEQVRDAMRRIHGGLANLGGSWRDDEYHKFAAELQSTLKALASFAQAAEGYTGFLRRKAEAADQFLRQR